MSAAHKLCLYCITLHEQEVDFTAFFEALKQLALTMDIEFDRFQVLIDINYYRDHHSFRVSLFLLKQNDTKNIKKSLKFEQKNIPPTPP